MDLRVVANPRSYATHLASVVCFLSTFAGHWPTRNERAEFSYKHDHIRYAPTLRYYLQVHFRCYKCPTSLSEGMGTDGLVCKRERGQIASGIFEETRISIFGTLSTGSTNPPFYRVLILGDKDIDFTYCPELPKGLEYRNGLDGTIVFQSAVVMTVGIWELEWNKVLDQIDNCLRIDLDEILDRDKLATWMFDDNFERSALYFAILQLLRIFGDCISTVSDDLHYLDSLFIREKGSFFPSKSMSPDEVQVMKSNWKSVLDVQEKAAKKLTERLMAKTEEVKSLRDGV